MIENQHTEFKAGRIFLIADVFYKAGQIENWGRGTIRMIEECEKEGLPEPHFAVNKTLFTFSFENENFNVNDDRFTDKVTNKESVQLSDNQRKILEMMREKRDLTLTEIAMKIGISKRKLVDNTNKIKQLGLLERIGNPKTGYWKVKD